MAILHSYALTTVADVKESLGIDAGNTTKDNLIIRKINFATDYIEKYCQRRFASTTYTDIEYDAPNSSSLVLNQRPVTAVSSFQKRNTSSNTDDWDDSDAEEYFLDSASGILELNYTATGSWNRYRVSYTAGYTTIPSDLGEACATLAAYLVENSSGAGGGVKRKREGQREIEYFQSGAGNTSGSLIDALGIDEVLAPYINYTLADYT